MHQQPSIDLVAHRLAQKTGYTIKVRSLLGSKNPQECMRNLRHSFLLVESPFGNVSDETSIIIDPCFRQQFVVAYQTSKYADVVRKLPEVFIGWMEDLQVVASWACNHLEECILQRGRLIPPWRRSKSILTKWTSQVQLLNCALMVTYYICSSASFLLELED